MKTSDLKRPDKLILQGLTALTDFTTDLYTDQKRLAKANAKLTYIGEIKDDKVHTQLYTYNPTSCTVSEDVTSFEFLKSAGDTDIHWLNVDGVHNVDLVTNIAENASLDRLTVRQILDTTQRPKIEDMETYISINLTSAIKKKGVLQLEHLSFALGKNYVLSFQEDKGDYFDGIRGKLNEGIGLLRKRGADFLFYQMVDAILDSYFETIDNLNDEISELEPQILSNPDKTALLQIESHKRATQLIKKSLSPLKEGVSVMLRGNSSLVKKANVTYYKDLANSVSAALEEVEGTLRALEGLTNIYFAALSQKMNETMKVLTTVATIFIPLTFIAGIYGMNFSNMPELQYKYGYFITWGVMLAIGAGMAVYFKRKKWF